MSNWLKRMKDIFFEGEDQTTYEKKQGGKSDYRQNPNSKGRIEDSNRTVEPRFVQRYPREGNFRFPLIPDEKRSQNDTYNQSGRKSTRNAQEQRPVQEPVVNTQVSKPSPRRDRKSRDQSKRHKVTEPRQKFAGVDFKASDIPSPIYGFGKRPEVFPPVNNGKVKEQQDNETNDHEILENEASSEQFPLISDLHNQEQNELYAENSKETKEEISETHEPSWHVFPAEDNVVEKWENDQDERLASTGVSHPVQESTRLRSEQIPPINDSEEAVKEEPVEEPKIMNWEVPGQTRTEQPAGSDRKESKPDRIERQREPQQTRKERRESRTRQTNQVDQDQDQRDRKRTRVPFNVMMLQKDRQQQRQKPPEHRAEQHRDKLESGYLFPSVDLLDSKPFQIENDELWLKEQKELLQSTLHNFNVKAHVIGATKGPSVTRIEVQPAPGVKVNKITNLSDDIKLSLAAKDIRIEAPIPGRNAIGIEVPNKVSKPVTIREIVTHPVFKDSHSALSVALGLDISGKPVITDLQKMPHGLIAGATGSGKSVCINSLLISILFKASPDDVKLLLIDPKMVELAPYNHLPHLVTPVITDAKEATLGLKWAVEEMERRYELFAHTGVRDMERYNKLVIEKGNPGQKLPYIVVVIDELADLMMVAPNDVEEAICRIAQKARACGIHLLLATQRPSVDVITGLIKANIPTRVAFAVSSQVDSRTIIDTGGAEKLLGRGDMLFLGNGVSKPVRIQGNFVSDDEIERITEHVKRQKSPTYLFEKEELVQSNRAVEQDDNLFDEAFEFVLEQGTASSSALQRRFRIGFNRAARLIDMMEAKGLISEAMGSKPRNVLVTKQDFYGQASEDIQQ